MSFDTPKVYFKSDTGARTRAHAAQKSRNSALWDFDDEYSIEEIGSSTISCRRKVRPQSDSENSSLVEECSPTRVESRSPCQAQVTPPVDTPPHRRMRSLRLNDTPHTPKSLVEKAQLVGHSRRSTRVAMALFASPEINVNSPNSCAARSVSINPLGPQTNINPFTSCRKRRRHETDCGLTDESILESIEDDHSSSSTKRLALSEINTSRYVEEFHELSVLGDGQFGSVYQCVNRLDGCTYAVKKSKMPVAGSVYERNAMNEVYAHAVLGKHRHVVRYFSAWAEANHMFIQNEYCNGGSLADVIAVKRQQLPSFGLSEVDLANILIQLAHGLKYIHGQGLIHLDIKPANVFIHRELVETDVSEAAAVETDVDTLDYDEDVICSVSHSHQIIYKIGDLGHVTSVTSPIVEEGDCRYLPIEILQERFDDLPKADIFSLALTIYEAGTLLELPKNGAHWHEIRENTLPDLPNVSVEFNGLIKLMANVDVKLRPSAASLTRHQALHTFQRKSYAQLYRELSEEKLKNQLLSRELVEFHKSGADFDQQRPVSSNVRRLLGRTCSRSTSLTVF